MTENQESDNKKHTRSPNGRPTIGFLNASGLQFFHQAWRGVADVAREHNVNAISFVGQYVRDTKDFKAQANILYALVGAECLDGLVIQNLMCNLLDPDGVRQFYEHYRLLPIVSLGRLSMEGVPYIQSGGYEGMRKAIVHLIEVHGRRRIAFVKGLPNYRPHDERYRAYVDALDEYGLPFDSARVAVPRDAAEAEQSDWGWVALCRLLDEQEADIDALVTNDDRFAHNLLPELQARGIRVPDDIALVSFDDEEGSHCLTPPLTTVPIPIYEMGRRAAETLLAKMEGQKVLDQAIDVPSDRLIVRQSCGCLDPKVTQVVAGPVVKTGTTEPLGASLVGQRESIVAEMVRVAENAEAGLAPGWAEQLLDSFVAALTTDMDEKASARFLSTLDDVLRQVMAAEGDIEVWQQVLFTLRRQLLPHLSIDQDGTLSRDRVEDLWLQAQAMIGGTAQRAQAYRELQAERRKRILNEIGTALVTNFDVNDLTDILARELPRLGISRGYLALYENPQPYRYPQPAPQWSRLVLAYDQGNPAGAPRVELEPGGHRFPSRQLVPQGILPQQEPYDLVVRALYFQDEQMGFILLDGDQQEGDVYDMLCDQIRSSLKGALLLDEIRKAQIVAEQARVAAEKADSLKTRLLANVSHELRTPLNVIIGCAREAMSSPTPYGTVLPDALRDDLVHIHYSAEHQLRVINDLLDLSRAEIDELDLYLEILDPRPLLEEVFRSMADAGSCSNVTWRLQLPDRLPRIQADPVRLRQILFNLLSNAEKFVKRGKIVLGAEVTPPHLHLWVQDTGSGISAELQRHIFEPFVTARRVNRGHEGVGLGLSITRRLVLLHRGSMELESQPGQGSTFHVYLPLPTLDDRTITPTVTTQRVLLLISSHDRPPAEIAEFSQRQELEIYRLQASDDLDAVVQRQQPAVLAWDMTDARPGDLALVRRLRNHPRLSQNPFILYGQEGGKEAALSIGMTNFVAKPTNDATLMDAINSICLSESLGPILIVDDDPQVLDLYRQVVAKGCPGYSVRTAADGAAAVSLMGEETPSLVILDLMMPEMDGFDVLDWMRESARTRQVPVLVLSSRLLSLDDVKRIEQHALVTLQSKGVLSADEAAVALNRALFSIDTLPQHTSALVKRAVAYFHRNYGYALSRLQIAEAIGVSEDYLSRIFRQEMNISPWEYLNRYRILRAKELLRCTSDTVKNVALRVGFTDPAYFSRVFRNVTGTSPSAYREHPNNRSL